MCLNEGDLWPFCDECWENRNNVGFELCPDCKEIESRICHYCETIFKDKDDLVDGICPKCREDNDLD